MPDLFDTRYATENTSNLAMEHHLLNLPTEILTQILHAVVPPFILSNIRVRWMFIRTNYQIRYLPIAPPPVDPVSVLLVCSKFRDLVLQMLYGQPYWQCDCRLERLRTQVGASNFASIRRMAVSMDDLMMIADVVEVEANGVPSSPAQTMRFSSLEELRCEGYEWDILLKLSSGAGDKDSNDIEWRKSSTTRYMAQNAASLCVSAAKLLHFHQKLDVLMQEQCQLHDEQSRMKGGSDAIDMSAGRVQWRFLRKQGEASETEEAVTINQLQALVQEMSRHDETMIAKTSWPVWLEGS